MLRETDRQISGKLELITSNKQEKNWKLTEFVEELKALEELAKMENLELFRRYKLFLINEIVGYMKTKTKGTSYEC